MPSSIQAIVVGVMGASTAYHLAPRSCTDVRLLEEQEFFGIGATGKRDGGVRCQFSTEINIRLSQLSLPMLERFEEEIRGGGGGGGGVGGYDHGAPVRIAASVGTGQSYRVAKHRKGTHNREHHRYTHQTAAGKCLSRTGEEADSGRHRRAG